MGNRIGELIKKYREKNSLTLSQLGSSLRNQDLAIETDEIISDWESGIHSPQIEIVKALSIIFRLDETEKADFFKAAGHPFGDESPSTKQHDEKIFRDGDAIFSENDLRELINNISNDYQYHGAQLDKMIKLIEYLASENNRYIKPELADQSDRLSTYLNNFWDFLKSNFRQGAPLENGEIIYFFKPKENSFETESFLLEFQMLSMDIENAFRDYRAEVIKKLQA